MLLIHLIYLTTNFQLGVLVPNDEPHSLSVTLQRPDVDALIEPSVEVIGSSHPHLHFLLGFT